MDLSELIVYRDDRIVGINKPAGLAAVHDGTPGEDSSLHAQVSAHLGRPTFIVHRLDRGTSGIVVFALDRDEHRRLSMAFEARGVRKAYLALVLGHVEPPSGEVDQPLRTFGSGRVGADPRGKPARTRYALRERLATADLLDVEPETGRRHQIRAHFYLLGHPILGDPRYGADRPVGGAPRLMLHATELVLPALDGEPLTLRAEPGPDFEAILAARRAG